MDKLLKIFPVALIMILLYSCKEPKQANISLTPIAGAGYKTGDKVVIKIHNPENVKPDSVIYSLDSVRVASVKDSSAITLGTDTMRVGTRLITAKWYLNGNSSEASTTIFLLPAKAPEEYTYKVEKVYPHDTSSYTEGLEYHDGYLYESTGNAGHSTLRKNNLETGKAEHVIKLDDKYFGEGLTMIGEKIIQFTYRQKIGFVYDKNTFKTLSTFPYYAGVEGWGVCNDGKKIFIDDSTNRIWFLDKNDYHETGYIDVYDNKTRIDSVNELEYIDHKLYSNVFLRDTILVIDPKTGAVLQRVDMTNLYPLADRPKTYDNGNNVLNGIAWDEKGKRLFITGKRWPHLYQVKFIKK
ncbi:MAG: glutaminyl-peptide cyclotransferase [Bacteroidota bacterium]|nr:glutaminyl-peptide cyclotransferase [Bacteroidota bacterium]